MTLLERDLIRWEEGELTLEDVEAAHPNVGIRELVRVRTRLAMLRAIPMPDVERAWTMTVSQLEDRGEPMMVRMRAWVRRPLVASFATVAMTGGVAYAAGVDPVERAVDGALQGITRVVTRDSNDARDVVAEDDGVEEGEPIETEPVVAATDAPPPGDDADGEHGSSKTKGNSADHRKDEENKHRGWDHKKDKDENENKGKEKSETPAANGSSGHDDDDNGSGHDDDDDGSEHDDDGSGDGSSNGNGSPDKDKSAHTEASDGSGGDPAPEDEDPPAPSAPSANGNAGGNGKGKDKTLR